MGRLQEADDRHATIWNSLGAVMYALLLLLLFCGLAIGRHTAKGVKNVEAVVEEVAEFFSPTLLY